MKKLATSLSLLLLMVALALGASGSKRLTIEESLAIKNVGGPQFSPDGQWIAYTLSEWDRENNRRVSHIYLVAADGGRPIKLTNGEKGESSPQWSPDGTRLAFTAERGDKERGNQIWLIHPSGGEAEKLTSEENGVMAFRWSPDGKRIAYVTRDAPKDKAEREKKKKEKFDAIVVDQGHLYSHLWTINVETKEKKRLTEGEFSASGPQFSPDGRWIAYVASRSGAQESSYTDISEDRNTDIYVVSADGGTSRRLTTNPAPDSNPRWSPDGQWIAYVANNDPKSWAAKSEIMVVAAAGGAPRNLTQDYRESAGSGLTWSPDGRALYFTSGVGVYNHIFSVPAGGGQVAQITRGNRNHGQFDLWSHVPKVAFSTPPFNPNEPAFTPQMKIAYAASDGRTPEDLWVMMLKDGAPRQITSANPQLAEFALAETEVLKWKGPDGFEIEGLLVKPLGYEAGKRYPLILQIHGGPYGKFGGSFNSRAQIFAAHGYAVLMPNPRGSTGYGYHFTVANVGDWGGKDFQDLMAGVDAVIAKGIADPAKLVVMGGSYGGFMTFWTITQTNRFKAAIGHAGISDWYSFHGQSDIPGLMEYGLTGYPWTATETYRKYSPMTYVERVKTPLLITHGEQDRRVPIAQAEQYYRALKKRGVEVVFIRYPREGHGIQEPNHQIDLVHRQLAWFDSHLGITRPKPAETKAVATTGTKN
jgi:dipeptidyl aminopeptidase/acylaminoacyl peptidase